MPPAQEVKHRAPTAPGKMSPILCRIFHSKDREIVKRPICIRDLKAFAIRILKAHKIMSKFCQIKLF
jgi:hypothetical protein